MKNKHPDPKLVRKNHCHGIELRLIDFPNTVDKTDGMKPNLINSVRGGKRKTKQKIYNRSIQNAYLFIVQIILIGKSIKK